MKNDVVGRKTLLANQDTLSVVMTNYSGRGGISQNAYCLTKALSGQGLNMHFLVPRLFESHEVQEHFRVKTAFEQLYDKRALWLKALTHIRNLRRLKQELTAVRPAICHLHEVKLPPFDARMLDWCHRNRIAVVYTAHDIVHPERRGRGRALRKFYHTVDAIIANAEENKAQLLQDFDVDPDRIEVLPGNLFFSGQSGSVSREDKASARKSLGLHPDIPVALFFGYIRQYKGLDILIEAIQTLHSQGNKVNLVIAGQPIEDFSRYKKLIDKSGCADYIHPYLDYIPEDEVAKFFLAADIVTLPYRSIFQSGVVPLAYAHARPVIGTRVGGLTEVIEDGRSGLLVPPDDHVKLAAGISALILNPDKLAEMGRHAYQLNDKYSSQQIASRTIKIYEKVAHQLCRVA